MYEMKGIRYVEGLLKFLLATAMAWLGCIALVSCDQGDTESENAEAHITLTLCMKGTDTDNYTRIGQSGGSSSLREVKTMRLKIRERRWKTVSTLADSTLFSIRQIRKRRESCKTWCLYIWAATSTG